MTKKKGALKAGMNSDILAIGGLLLTLFLLMVITGVAFIGAGELKEVVCENADSSFEWNESTCWNMSYILGNGTVVSAHSAQTVDGVTHIETVEAVILTVLGLLSLVVIVGLFAIVIKAAIGFARNF